VSRVEHTDRTVTLIRTRLVPPWMNTSLVLRGHDRSAVATTWFGARRKLRGALRSAGFNIEEKAAWFDMGGALGV
jgi:hypothetical protein